MTNPDQLPGFSMQFSLSGKLEYLSAPFLDALGYNADEIVGSQIDMILPIYTRLFFQTHLIPLLRLQGHAQEIFLSFITCDAQELPVVMNFQTGKEQAGLVNALGITVRQRKKYEDDLIKTRKELEKSIADNSELIKARTSLDERARQLDQSLNQLHKRHDELRQFSKVITHDLQEPIRKLHLYHSMLNSDTTRAIWESPTVMSKMERAVEQLDQVVRGLQEFMWLSEGPAPFVNVDLNEVITTAKNEASHHGDDYQFTLTMETMPTVSGNREQLIRMFVALFENSIKFRIVDQPLVVSVESRIVALNSFRRIEGRYDYADVLQIHISDNGPGFDPQQQDSVFDVFTKLHHGPGRGLGLAICRRIMENHHGSITADPKPGFGTTIILEFPPGAAL